MNRIFRIVWNKAISQLVVTSELGHRSSGGSVSERVSRDARSTVLPLATLAIALCFAMPAAAVTRLPMPGGAILDINNGSAPNSASNTANQFQNYSVTFTAAETGNNYILFAFRQDPRYWTFGNVSMFAAGDTSTNLFTNPLFTQGGEIGDSGIQAPAGWGVVYQTGIDIPQAAGTWHAPGSTGVTTTNVNTADAGSWYDGAVGSFDGIYQGVDLVAGITYTINFTALSNNAANTAGSGTQDVEMGVFAGTCLTLTGPVANCVPDNPDFQVLATPDDAANAGGPSVVPIATPTTTTDLGTTDGAFDGGTLVVDQDDVVADQDFTVSHNGGTIDQNGRDSTFTGTISDETAGTPGDLAVTNSGNGGSVTLTGENTYTGHTSIDDGATLELSGDGSISSSNGVTNNGTLDIGGANGTETIASLDGSGTVHLGENDLDIANANGTFGGNIDGDGGVSISGGTQTFTGDNTYTGGTTVTDATVSIDNGNALGTGTVTLGDGTLNTSESMTLGNAVELSGTGTVDTDAGTTLAHTGTVSGDGDFVEDGAGTLDQSGNLSQNGATIVNDGTLILSGNNTYTGPTVVNADGTLQVSSDANLGALSSDLALNGGTLHATGNVITSRDVSLNGGGTFDIDTGKAVRIDATVTGNGGLTQEGGQLILTRDNSYTGGTSVTDGTLFVYSDGALGTGTLSLDDSTLHVASNQVAMRDIDVTGTGTITTDSGVSYVHAGAVTGTGDFEAYGHGQVIQTGALTQDGATIANAGVLILGSTSNTYGGGTQAINGGTVQISSDANLGAPEGDITLGNGGTLYTTATMATSRDVTLVDGGATANDAGETLTLGGTISGNGGLVHLGQGTLVLGGENTYTGGTTVGPNAVISVSDDANLGDASGSINLAAGELLATDDVDSARDIHLSVVGGIVATEAGVTFATSGGVSGDGTFYKAGEGEAHIDGDMNQTGGVHVMGGTLVLGGNNGYLGQNQIDEGGTLQVSSDANLGAGGDLVFDGGMLHTTGTFNSDRNLVLDGDAYLDIDAGTTLATGGTASGSGSLVKDGEGRLVIGGVASHTGGTIVNDGTLVLTANNTYTGGTTINGGTLQISSDANLGDASNDIAINGGNLSVTQTMTTDRDIVIGDKGASLTTADGVTLNQKGDMSGTGGLIKLGGGTLVVYGNNTFAGGTLIQGGVIRINSGSSLGTGRILLQGGTLQSDASLGTGQEVIISGDSGVNVAEGTTTVLSGNMVAGAGNGCFVKSGKGYLSLTGRSSLGSGTCVQEGVLSANGQLSSSYVQVDKAAMLRGTGVIAGPVNVEGRLAAGNSPGTLTVAGPVTMQAGSTLQVDIDGLGTGNGAGNYSRVLVVGESNRFIANGTLAPTLRGITGNASNTYTPALGDTYRIVTADGGVEGRFSTLEQPADGLAANTRFLAFYGANAGHSIDLRVAPVSYAELLGTNAKRNGLAAAGALDGAVSALDAGSATAAQNDLLYAVSSLGADGVATMVNSLSGEVHADQAAAARNAGLGMQRDVSDHLGTDKSADVAHSVWANVTRDGNRSIADGQGSGFETGTDRTTGGIDLYADNGTTVGVAVTHHDTNVIAHGGSGSIRGNSGIVYAQQAMGSFVLDGMAAYGSTDWTTRRADPMGGAQLETRTSGKDGMASATLRMPMQTAGGARVEPYASVVWQKVERDAANEHGSVAALSVDKLSEKGARVLAGVTMGSKAADPLASALTWRAGIAVGADTGDLLDPTVHDTLAGQRFDSAAPGVGRGFVQVNANGTMRLGKSTYLYGGLTAEEGSRRSAYGVTAGVRVAF